MINNVGYFCENGILIYTKRNTANRLCCQFRINPLGAVITDNRKLVFSFESQSLETQGKIPHMIIILLPGNRLPNTIFFLTQSYPTVTVTQRIALQQEGKWFALNIHCCGVQSAFSR